MRRAIGEMLSEPLAEQVFHFPRKSQQGVAGERRAGLAAGLEHDFDFVFGESPG